MTAESSRRTIGWKCAPTAPGASSARTQRASSRTVLGRASGTPWVSASGPCRFSVRLRRSVSDGGALLALRHAEGRAAAARGDHVGVLHLEPGALEAFDEVDRRAAHVGQGLAVDEEGDALVLEGLVAVAALVEGQHVLKARATAAADADAQPRGGYGRALSGEELADLVRADVGQGDHAFGSIVDVQWSPPRS